MDSQPTVAIDAWLRAGGLVVASSDRAARAMAAGYHGARRAEGLTAWPAPAISEWRSFARDAWDERAQDGRLVLNPLQEKALWVEIAAAGRSSATTLEGPRQRLASLAMESHALLCSYADSYLEPRPRQDWQQDPGAFSKWLTAFDERCQAGNLLSATRLPLELIGLLSAETAGRPPLLLAGFDRLLPVQRKLFDAWGAWQLLPIGAPAAAPTFYEAADAQAELAACALWCRGKLAAHPEARLLVIAQAASARRGEMERAFLRYCSGASEPRFEFSLGVPLSQVAPARAALMALRWLDRPLGEDELDWLLSTGHVAATAQESAALEAWMRDLRRHDRARPEWTLEAFTSQSKAGTLLPRAWVERALEAQRRRRATPGRRSPMEWAEFITPLLQQIGFPGWRPLSSSAYQAIKGFEQAVDACGSLGFDGRRVSWQDFLSELGRALDEALFAPQSRNAPIQIAGPAESAGLEADAVWFLGATEEAWPAGGSTHPLLPLAVQREAAMPHATPLLDWELAHAITQRLLGSAGEAHFSYARQSEKAEGRPSRLIALLAGKPVPMPQELARTLPPKPATEEFEDFSRIPFEAGGAGGGSSVLTTQSNCPFKAFATARLGAQGWEAAEPSLTPRQRGTLLHEVLHSVWGGPPQGIRSLKELRTLADPEAFVVGHVGRVFEEELRPHLRERLSPRYLELEAQRLIRLVTEWLAYEATRCDFDVTATEIDGAAAIRGLSLKLRLDRIDRLNDGTVLVVDYKSGRVSPNDWKEPRPRDAQLPLYACFALDRETQPLGGLVFATLRTGELGFAGRVGDAAGTLLPSLKSGSALVKNSLDDVQVEAWRECIEQLAENFLAGRAEVDPRDGAKTCKYCDLQALCRIQERGASEGAEDGADGEEGGDE